MFKEAFIHALYINIDTSNTYFFQKNGNIPDILQPVNG